MKIVITHIDSVTGILCTTEPMRNGPALPKIKGWVHDWANESQWPIACVAGVYQTCPKIYGTCDDDADISASGVLEVLSEADWLQQKYDEFYARQPYESWIFDSVSLLWSAPVVMPEDGKRYTWDETTTNWIEVTV